MTFSDTHRHEYVDWQILRACRLLVKDKPGIVQAVSSFLYHHGANITALDQYATEAQGGRYFMRVEFELDNLQSRKDNLLRDF